MSILTRFTKKTAERLLPQTKYVVTLQENVADAQRMPVFLTFDDGPHPNHTPRLLDQLAKFNAKATFFMVGEHAQRWPDIVRRTIAEGHSVGSHSWHHWSVRNVTVANWIKDVQRARHELENIIEQQCCLFRPPYGELTPLSLLALLLNGFRIIHWSQDTRDFEATSQSQFCEWFVNNEPASGSVVLLHDNQMLTSSSLLQGCSHWQPGVVFRAIPMMMPKHGETKNITQNETRIGD